MIDHDALFSVFQDYSTVLLRPYRIGDVLYRLTDQVVDVLGVDGSGVSLRTKDDTLEFVAATDASVATVEAQQEAGGVGPCHEAFRTGNRVMVGDLAEADHWGRYREVALEEGCRAVAGIPMPLGEHRIGALNLYRSAPHDWADDELDAAQVLANMATGYVLNHTQMSETRTVVDQLQQALDSRVIIEQAKGVVANRDGVSPEAAFEQLRKQARSTNTRLHDLCAEVVEGATPD